MHVARLLVNELDKFSRFKGRELNSHFPSVDIYNRLLAVWRPMWDLKVKSGTYELSANDLIDVLREKIHPEHREPRLGGGWTFDPSKLKS